MLILVFILKPPFVGTLKYKSNPGKLPFIGTLKYKLNLAQIKVSCLLKSFLKNNIISTCSSLNELLLFDMGSTLKRKNLLLEEQILSF